MAEGKKNIWKRVAKVAAWTIGSVVALTALVLCLLVWIFTPSRLTPMVRDIAAEYIDGDVSIGKVELTVWSTFPNARIDIDSLAVRSAALESSKSAFTAYTDTLLAFDHLHGGIDLSRLATGEIRLTDVEIRALGVNALALDSSRTNFDILRIPSDTTAEESAMTELPDISIERFAILDSQPIRYVSIADSIDAALMLETTQLTDDGTPVYRLSTGLKAGIDIAPGLSISDFTISTDGRITWEHTRPYSIALDGFTIGVNRVPLTLSTAMDFAETLRIERLAVEMPATRVTDLLGAIPEGLSPELPEIKSPLTIALKATLAEPYDIATDTIPTIDVALDIPGGDVNFGNEFFIDDIALNLTAHVDGKNPDLSTVDVARLYFRRLGTEFTATGSGTRLFSDPKVIGTFDGSVDFDRLPPRLTEYIPGEVRGLLTAKSDFNFKLSDLTPNDFHHARLSGEVTLKDFGYSLVDSVETRLYTRNAQLRLGTSDAFTTHSQQRIDSLLTLSIKLDTMSLYYDRMDFEMSNLRAGLGCQNSADSRDSTQVNPIGGSLRFDRFNFTSPDSTRIRLQDIKARTTLRRYEGNSRLPEVLAKVSANRVRYVDRLNRLSLSEGEFDLRANIKALRQRTATDSTARAMRQRRAMMQSRKPRGSEALTMDLDSTTQRFIRRLNLRGSIKAKRGRIFTPYFPLRNSVSDLNMAFTSDSVTFEQVRLRSGNSDFTLSGKITNISRFLTSRYGAPLHINFESHSHKIDVNRLSYAAFAGAAFAERADSVNLSYIDDENRLEEAVEETAGDGVAAIIVPINVEAFIALTADTIVYTDMALNKFKGLMQMHNGAINLSDLSARTNFGSAHLTALYSAPRKNDIRFGFGMRLDSVDLKEAIGLIPSVDSLMPLMRNFAGIVNADVAATTDVDSAMNFVLPTLNAAIKLEGDSLVLLDPDTFKSVSKWLLFKKKDRNVIDHMGVELLVRNSTLELFPFMFDIDRYRLGIMGYNDMALNLNYHVSVLKSPLPFKFGINITGNTDDMKIRLGKARYNESSAGQMVAIADTTRVNLLKQIENVFRRGAATTRLDHIKVGQRRQEFAADSGSDTISSADSLQFIKAGILPPRDTVVTLQP